MRVRKAVVPAAGYGTRWLPTSKVVPKELLPIVDRPMVHYVVEEAMAAGITQFIIVTSRGKEALADYFDRAPELEALLHAKGDREALASVRAAESAEFTYVRQTEQLGLGHAVYVARHAVGDEPFAVLLPDDIIVGREPAIGQVTAVAQRYGASAVAVEQVPAERISAYGVVAPRPVEERVYQVLGLVEKPPREEAPSDLGIVGRYVLTPEIFDALARVKPGARGELQLTDAIALLRERQEVYACQFTGTRYDAGTPLGLLQASVALALKRRDTGPALRAWLEALLVRRRR